MLKVASFCLSLALLLAGFYSVAPAQVAVEYGIIGSKPPPAAADSGRSISKKIEAGLKQTPSPDQSWSRETQRQTTQAGTTGGPLIIEQRGDHYERVK